MIDPILQIKANLNAFSRFPNARGISNTSGGIGKKDASAVEIRPSAAGPEGFSAQDKTQLYNSLMWFMEVNCGRKHQLQT
jgi:hypothetical protein